MMIIEPPIAARFHAGATALPHNNRSMWSADDVNGVRCVASCRLAWSCGFDVSRVRSKIYTGTPFTRRNKLLKNRIRASQEHLGSAQDPVKKNDTNSAFQNDKESLGFMKNINYGRLISFGKDIAELHSSKLERLDFRGALKGRNLANTSNCDVWTEYHDMGVEGIKAVTDHKAYTADSVLDLLHFVAPKMMKRGDAHFSYGIADDLDDEKYKHYKYWSNPLETTLPNAPDMEIYSMYGVGIPTERAYVYKLTPQSECHIPFQIDTSANGGNEDTCLRDGVYSSDGDETVPVLSAGFMCAKGWRGITRFNPSGIRTFIREYDHAPPANLLEGRGTQSGAHVDILGNFALLEDIIRVAAGASGEDLGGDRVHSDIFKWSEKIILDL